MFARVVAHGTDGLTRLFIANGAPTLSMTKSGESALVSAAGKGDLELVRILLHQPSAPPAAVITCALGAAAHKGDLPLVQFLIGKGAQPNGALCGRSSGTTVLIQAAESGNAEVLEEILKYHPSLEVKDLNGSTALSHVLQRGIAAPYNGKGLRLLISAGADVNSRDSNQQTPVFAACMSDDPEAMHVLANAGANLNAKDRNGQTVLMSCSYIKPLKELVKAGADPSIVNDRGQTAAQEARQMGALDKAALLEAAAKTKN